MASEIIEEFDIYGGGSEEEENRACEELEKMQELFGDHNEYYGAAGSSAIIRFGSFSMIRYIV